jgi:3-dehydroquinate dehydratase / shikimate dehydrogenase
MLCIGIKEKKELAACLNGADLIEIRLDLFPSWEELDLQACPLPILLTPASLDQETIRKAASLKPDYLDIDWRFPHASNYPGINLIISYHNFLTVPENLDELFLEMKKRPARYYKIAVMPQTTVEALKFLLWAKSLDEKIIAVCMGPFGQFTRILGPVIGTPITYASLEEGQEVAPGQLPAKILLERYHHRALNPETSVFGLIGDPVEHSISDVTHNHYMGKIGFNGVYVKMQVPAQDLPEFLTLAKQLPFKGLSVTMPLKEAVISCLDGIDPEAEQIGAVNTLLFDEGKILGFNTDGKGACDAIEKKCSLEGKQVVLLGAGGAAKAIAHAACARGANVAILNRDPERAAKVAKQLSCASDSIEKIAAYPYDILINCTPTMPITPDSILEGVIVMDIKTRPKETPLLRCALEKGCRVVYGEEMFMRQAAFQYKIWRNSSVTPSI